MTAADVHPPLYYLIVKTICAIFGMSGPVLHIISIIPLVIILVFSLTIVWKKFGACAALVLMTMTSISDAAIRFNVEIRMYSWAALFVLFSYYYFYKIVSEDNNRDYILFSVFSLAAAYTHYYALIAVAFFYAVLFFRALLFKRDQIKRTLVIIGVAIAVYLPWLFVLIKSLTTRVDNYWISENSSFKECFNFIFSDKFYMICWAMVVVLAAVSFIYMIRNREEDGNLLLLIASGMISVTGTMAVGIGISALLSPFFVTRYIYVVCPVAWLVFGILLSKLRLNWLWTGVFIVCFIYSIIPSYKATYYDDIEVASRTDMVRDIVAQLDEDDLIVTNFYDLTIPEWYFYGHEYVQVIDLQDLDISVSKGKDCWLIVGDEWSYDDISNKVGEQGYSCETVLDYGLLGHSKVLVFKVDR